MSERLKYLNPKSVLYVLYRFDSLILFEFFHVFLFALRRFGRPRVEELVGERVSVRQVVAAAAPSPRFARLDLVFRLGAMALAESASGAGSRHCVRYPGCGERVQH